jgi:hypothetical protein
MGMDGTPRQISSGAVSDPPLVAAPLYGLRAWTVVGPKGDERLAGPQRRAPWPAGGEWLEASCDQSPEHRPPGPDCGCGVHAWHPSRRAARRVLASRRQIPGIIEATGATELHRDGFRAERARPYALVLLPGRNARLVQRLADEYAVEVVEADGPNDLLSLCRDRGLGLDEATVTNLLGPETEETWRRARRKRIRRDLLRLAALVAVVALLVVAALELATYPPGERTLQGRTGEVHIDSK